MIFIFEKG
ncbi:Protein of unknown function [Bacillus mycoides]|nr:Protein of unknown function [Bacillus mycoides]